jgi:hypothetical protein
VTAVAITPPPGDQVILGLPHLRSAAAELLRAGFDYYFPDTGGVVFRARAGIFVVRARLSTDSGTPCRLDLGLASNRHGDGPVHFRPWSIPHPEMPGSVAREAVSFFRVVQYTV